VTGARLGHGQAGQSQWLSSIAEWPYPTQQGSIAGSTDYAIMLSSFSAVAEAHHYYVSFSATHLN